MKLNIYQSYYDDSQLGALSKEFIPYNNTGDPYYMFRENIILRRLQYKHINDDSYWGLVSWRWNEKTGLDSKEFVDWIKDNPGYDMYFFDPNLDTILHKNLWTQGDPWHPGMINFCNRLLEKMEIDLTVYNLDYKSKHFISSNFMIGNNKFWKKYLSFVNEVITLCLFDEELEKYMFRTLKQYNGVEIPFFCFVIERLASLYYFLNDDKCKFLKFPVEHKCYENRHGPNYQTFLQVYKSKE